MSLEIIMLLMGSIDIPMNVGKRVGKSCELQVASGDAIF
jgi:hypothetical protein